MIAAEPFPQGLFLLKISTDLNWEPISALEVDSCFIQTELLIIHFQVPGSYALICVHNP